MSDVEDRFREVSDVEDDVEDRFREVIEDGTYSRRRSVLRDDIPEDEWNNFADNVAADAIEFLRNTKGNTYMYLRMLALKSSKEMESAKALKEIIYSEMYADIADRLYALMREDE